MFIRKETKTVSWNSQSHIRKQLRTKGEHLTVGAISSAWSFILFLACPGMESKTVRLEFPLLE